MSIDTTNTQQIKRIDRFAPSTAEKAIRFLRSGGSVLLDTPWPEAKQFFLMIQSRRSELLRRPEKPTEPAGRRRLSGRDRERLVERALDRILVRTMGRDSLLADTGSTVAPVTRILAAELALERPYPVEALGPPGIIAHAEVLAPKSQETYWLIRRALEHCAVISAVRPASILDVGCGSGVTSLLAARVLGPLSQIVATDVNRAALWSTVINAEKHGVSNVHTTAGGDLFDPVSGEQFDLIMFNAPWVNAPARNMLEMATNDARQQTVFRFIDGAALRLRPGGHVLVGYSDHSGDAAVGRLLTHAEQRGLHVQFQFRDQIKTHRANSAWEVISVYGMQVG